VTERVEPIGIGEEETKERDGAFPRFDEAQRERLRKMGRAREVEAGEVLFRAGDETTDFFVVESGAVTIVQGLGAENRVIAVHGEGRFLGELSLLVGQRLYLSGVVRDAGELIQIPLPKLREIIDEDETLSDVILGAFMARRSILIGAGTGVKVIGSRFSPDSHRLRELLARNRMPYQ
jgi:thioredoxin reductase (NADPH)